MENISTIKLSNEDYENLISKTLEGSFVKEKTIVSGKVISIENEQLVYKAYTATGEEYDKAVISKDFLTGIKTLK